MLKKSTSEGNYSISNQLWNENENELQTIEEIESQLRTIAQRLDAISAISF